MSEEKDQLIPLYVDFLPNHATNPMLADSLKDSYRKRLESDLDNIVTRQGQLSTLMVKPGEYVQLLVESRTLFCFGYYYACVAMCGIVAERIIKNIMRNNVYTVDENVVSKPSDKAFDQLERVDIRSITNFLAEAKLIELDVKTAAINLSDLRNQYVHARGQNPEKDALKAITHLQKIVDETVSILKSHTISEGRLVAKTPADTTVNNDSTT